MIFVTDVFDHMFTFPTDSTGATLIPPIFRPKGIFFQFDFASLFSVCWLALGFFFLCDCFRPKHMCFFFHSRGYCMGALIVFFFVFWGVLLDGSFVFSGPRPGPPRNVTVTEIPNGFLITWESPSERAHLTSHFTIKYRTDAQWRTLNKGTIRPEETQYLGKVSLKRSSRFKSEINQLELNYLLPF